MDAKNLAEQYDLPDVAWSTVTTRLEGPLTQAPGTGGPGRHTCWLATIDPDGAPHVTGPPAAARTTHFGLPLTLTRPMPVEVIAAE